MNEWMIIHGFWRCIWLHPWAHPFSSTRWRTAPAREDPPAKLGARILDEDATCPWQTRESNNKGFWIRKRSSYRRRSGAKASSCFGIAAQHSLSGEARVCFPGIDVLMTMAFLEWIEVGDRSSSRARLAVRGEARSTRQLPKLRNVAPLDNQSYKQTAHLRQEREAQRCLRQTQLMDRPSTIVWNRR